MNYRHQFHAGNYADVFKHVLLVQLIRAMQRKDKGFLYLDTHAGRGSYDLAAATLLADGRKRPPEHPKGIGRLWPETPGPAALAEYLNLVRTFNTRRGAPAGGLEHYPGSPWIAHELLRNQDRAALCELRPDEAEVLAQAFSLQTGVSVQAMDGYTALRAMLPPPEKRALVLIDPPFEDAGEFDAILGGLREAFRRFPNGVYAIWYPITERARSERFLEEVAAFGMPALVAEFQIAADSAAVRMKGCGLLVLNPPWQIDREFRETLPVLADRLRLDAGAAARVSWLVPEK